MIFKHIKMVKGMLEYVSEDKISKLKEELNKIDDPNLIMTPEGYHRFIGNNDNAILSKQSMFIVYNMATHITNENSIPEDIITIDLHNVITSQTPLYRINKKEYSQIQLVISCLYQLI